MKTVIGFSGGMDSTYLLWNLLANSSDEITAVFIDMQDIPLSVYQRYDLRNFTGSSKDVALAAAQWLSDNVRAFNFIVHPFDQNYVVRGFGNCNNPQTYVARYAIPRINANEFDRLVAAGEKENDGFGNGGTVEVRRPGSFAVRDLFVAGATRGSVDFPLIASNYTQAVAMMSMPTELRAIVDFCTPDSIAFECKKRAWFQALIDQGKTQQEIFDIWYANCTSPYVGKWFSMKYWLEGVQAIDQNTWAIPEWPTSYTVP
jgi:hypothetical protein